MSAATVNADATTTASAANETWIFKRKCQWCVGNTRDSLAAINDYCSQAGVCFPSVSGSPLPFFFYISLLVELPLKLAH